MIDSSKNGVKKYDKTMKAFISNKAILSWILKICVDEFKENELFEIEKSIESDIHLNSELVNPRSGIDVMLEGCESIVGSNSEDNLLDEGTVHYDIKFMAKVPNTDRQVQLIINVESQNNFNPGYPIKNRIVYYLSRLISSQYGKIFKKSQYDKICKVYSIWIFLNPPKNLQNTISKISLIEENVFGNEHEVCSSDIDLMEGILINLGKESKKLGNDLLELFNLFLNNKNTSETKSILENHYKIKLTKDMEEEVDSMGSWAEGFIDRGIEIGIEQGIEQGIEKSELDIYSNLAKNIKKKQKLMGDSLIAEIADYLDRPIEKVNDFFKQHPEIDIN